MIYTWVPEDIIAGRKLRNRNDSEDYIIGYFVTTSENRYTLISLIDGQIHHSNGGRSKAEIATYCNALSLKPLSLWDKGKLVK